MRRHAIYSKTVRQCTTTSEPDYLTHLMVLQIQKKLILVSSATHHGSKSFTLYSETDKHVH